MIIAPSGILPAGFGVGMLDKLSGRDELYIPATAVDMVSEDRVVLETTSDRIDQGLWSKPGNVDTFRRR